MSFSLALPICSTKLQLNEPIYSNAQLRPVSCATPSDPSVVLFFIAKVALTLFTASAGAFTLSGTAVATAGLQNYVHIDFSTQV